MCDKSRIPESASVTEALLMEFDTDDSPVRSQVQAIFDEVTSSSASDSKSLPRVEQEHAAHIQAAAAQEESKQVGPGYYSVQPPYKPADAHPSLWSTDPIDPNFFRVGNGRRMLALFDDEYQPRTRYSILVEDDEENNWVRRSVGILPARLTLQQICQDYPEKVRGSLLLVYSAEGWTPQLIWNHLPKTKRHVSPGDCPWAWLDEALDKEMGLLAAAEEAVQALAENAQASEEKASISSKKREGEDDPEEEAEPEPAAKRKKGPRPVEWTEKEVQELASLREKDRKTWKEIASSLEGRTERGCTQRYYKYLREKNAPSANSSTLAVDAPDLPAAEDAVEGNGDAMMVD